MLAADELAPDDPDALRATGYLVRSWYKFNRNKWLDDAIEHTGKAFLGLTFNCCRCHDHMYDPLAAARVLRAAGLLRAVRHPHRPRAGRGRHDEGRPGARVRRQGRMIRRLSFMRGNEKNPLKDEPLAPAVPQVFGDVPLARSSRWQLPQIRLAIPG